MPRIMTMIEKLPETTVLLYSELLQQIKTSEALRSIGHLKGSEPVLKIIKLQKEEWAKKLAQEIGI